MTGPAPGLCGACRHSRLVVSARGSAFRLCERSVSDPRFPRYPTLPVLACAGFETPATLDGAAGQRKPPRMGPKS